jgi:uncharacterized protein YdaU (DUF1376 family)
MKTEPELPLNVGEFVQDTMGFDSAEIGSYVLLIIDYWANAGPPPNDDKYLRQVARCPETEWARTKGVLACKFDVSNGRWRHGKLDALITASKARRESVAKASAAGVQARRDRGLLPPLAPPPAEQSGSVVDKISQEKALSRYQTELTRVEKRLEEVRNQGLKTATETIWTTPQRAEMKVLRERKDELRKLLGFVA